jgi:nucleotide-binding universal stress UspA family protein
VFKHILFPTDGSELSREALTTAVDLAQSLGARISAIQVIPPYVTPIADLMWVYPDSWSEQDYQNAAKQASASILERVRAAAKTAGIACETQSVVARAPWEAIVKAAKKHKCDLIVMASHGRRGLAGIILGSQTQKVLTHSAIPVLVCR